MLTFLGAPGWCSPGRKRRGASGRARFGGRDQMTHWCRLRYWFHRRAKYLCRSSSQ